MLQLDKKNLSFLINTTPIFSLNNLNKIFLGIKDFNVVRFHFAIFTIPITTAWAMIAPATTTYSAVSYGALLVAPTVP